MAFNNKENRIGRSADTLTNSQFNLVLGGMLLWGFLLNLVFVVLFQDYFLGMNTLVLCIGYLVLGIVGILISLSTNPLLSFLGYNMVVVPSGAVLSVVLIDYGSQTILKALTIVCIVTVIMLILSVMYPSFFLSIGKTLFISLLVGLILEVISMLLGFHSTLFDWAFVLIFSGYLGFDFAKAQAYDKTLDNAIDSALDLYLDIINLFVRILRILGKDND